MISSVSKKEAAAAEWCSLQLGEIGFPVEQESKRSSHQSREGGSNQDLLTGGSRGSGLSAGAGAWKRGGKKKQKKTSTVDLISVSQISSKAWSQPTSAFPQQESNFFLTIRRKKLAWPQSKRGLHKNKKKQQKKKMIRELTQITHRAQGVKLFMPALLCQAAPSQIVSGLNRRPHRGQTPVACSHKLACFVSESSSYLVPAELNPSSWHLNASWSLFPFPYPPQLEGVGETEVNESEWVEFCPLSAVKGASNLQLLPVELLVGNRKTRLLLCSAGVNGCRVILILQSSVHCVCVCCYHPGVHNRLVNATEMQHNTEKKKLSIDFWFQTWLKPQSPGWKTQVWHIQQHNLISAWTPSLFIFIIVSFGHHSKKLCFGLWSLKLKSGNTV